MHPLTESLTGLQTNATYNTAAAISLIFSTLLIYAGLKHFRKHAWIFVIGSMLFLADVWVFIAIHLQK